MRSSGRNTYRHCLAACFLLLVATRAGLGQHTSSCGDPDWFTVQQQFDNGEKLSPLCKAELDGAANHVRIAERELKAIIKQAPRSGDAYDAHSTLTHLYLRVGRFRDAEAEVLALLALKPDASDLKNTQSLFALLGRYPDLTVSGSHPAIVRSRIIDGNIFAPVTVNDSKGMYMLDTGINLSIMSKSEAARLGLKPQSSITKLTDIGGTIGAELQVTEVDDLLVGATHLRHVPFLVMDDTNGAFAGLSSGYCGILGIQPLLAMGSIRFQSETLEIGGKSGSGSKTVPLLFDRAMPLTQIIYQAKPLTVTFDVGATQTTLNSSFAKLYPELLKTGARERHDMNGLSGTTARNSISVPDLAFTFGRRVDLAPATILTDQTTGTSIWAAANLGYDLMQQARPFTIDFQSMRILFDKER